MPILMSIRKIHVDDIRNGAKRIEFRKKFTANYIGSVFVYESGADGRHEIVGTFRTEGAKIFIPGKQSLDDMCDCFGLTDYTTFDVKVLARQKEPIWCIPIIDWKEIKHQTLQEFSKNYSLSTSITRPPMSWQKIMIGDKKGG